jgi:TatD DNase family protein
VRLFDSHCHLTDERFADDRAAVLARARAAGVLGCVTVASDPDDADRARALARESAAGPVRVWATAGIHPHAAAAATPDALARVESLGAAPEVVAVGETGLDYHYLRAPRDAQRASFAAHLEIAERAGKPVVVHTRSCDGDAVEFLRGPGRRVRGVLHAFTGGDELLRAALDAGWYVSFAGIVTFRNFAGAAQVRAVPDDRLLVETDSPYLAPVPHRGRRNEPAYVRAVLETVAAIRGADPAALAERTCANALAFYGVAV